jgi:FAD/FMN-containing dehydrogenase
MVTAAGERVRASAGENPELFWGIRGGGGNFGVVTSFEYRLHAVGPVVFGGAIFYPLDRARDLLRVYGEWAPDLPDEMTTMVAFLTAPPEPFVPPELVGSPMVAIALCHAGPLEQGEKLVQPLRDIGRAPAPIDLLGPIPYGALQRMFDASAPWGHHAFWKTEYLRALDDETVAILCEHATRMRSPFSAIHIHHLEGAVKRLPDDSTAFAHRDARWVLNIVGLWSDPGDSEEHVGWVRELWQAIQPSATGAAYLNFLGEDGPDRVRAAYGADKYARLAELKKAYDPDNFFRLNQNIRPAR